MNKIYSLVIISVFAVSCTRHILRISGDMPFTEPATGLFFGEEICSIDKIETFVYPSKAAGVSFRYQSEDEIVL